MPLMNLTVPSYESALLWRFFDSVSAAVSMRMQRGSVPGEENLTFLLCELLDEGATGLHALDYSLAQLKADLEKSDAGVSIDVGFETHEHTKYFESKYSGADLGVVLSIDHPILGKSQRAILVQAKKLFAGSQSKEFSLWSKYSSFDKEQAEFLRELAGRFDTWNSIFSFGTTHRHPRSQKTMRKLSGPMKHKALRSLRIGDAFTRSWMN